MEELTVGFEREVTPQDATVDASEILRRRDQIAVPVDHVWRSGCDVDVSGPLADVVVIVDYFPGDPEFSNRIEFRGRMIQRSDSRVLIVEFHRNRVLADATAARFDPPFSRTIFSAA